MNRMLKGMAVVAGMLVWVFSGLGQSKGNSPKYERRNLEKAIHLQMSYANDTAPNPSAHEHADFNADGKMDYIEVSRNGNVFLFINEGNNEFERQWIISNLNQLTAVTVNDFNMDGYPDAIVGDGNGHLHYLENDKSGSFKQHVPIIDPDKIKPGLVSLDSYTDKNKYGDNFIALTAITANGERYEIRGIDRIIKYNIN
jgi:hypothetical protein